METVLNYPALNRPKAPDCSVCIANYNGTQWLVGCIESVLTQLGDVSCEILVHDDASTDGSVAWLREHYPQVEILASSENVGFCIANNRMVAHARGEYVLLLNNDAALHPDALSTLLREATSLASPGIVTLPQYDWASGVLVDRGCRLDLFYNPVPNLDPLRQDVGMAVGACLFLSRAMWGELGGFPVWIGSIAEDVYLCCLARLRGYPVRVATSSGYRHWQGASFGGNRVSAGKLHSTYRRRSLSERNRLAVTLVCTPTAFVWPLLALHYVVLGLEGGLLTMLKRDGRIWKDIYGPALAYPLRNFGALREHRDAAQSMRCSSLGGYFRGFVGLPRKLVLLWRHGLPSVG